VRSFAPRYSPAKRRYLAHLKTNCTAATLAANATGAKIQKLVREIGEGRGAALGELIGYLARMANAFGASLQSTRSFGRPPNPDRDQALLYFREAGAVIAAIKSLGAALEVVKTGSVESAIHRLTAASNASQTAAERYGIPTCHSGRGGSRQPSGPAV
jgi:hypothetical protein